MTNALDQWNQLNRENHDHAYQMLYEALEAIPSTFHPSLALQILKREPKPAFNELQEALAAAILNLLQRDLNRLMQILYRVDVSETRVNQAFQSPFSEIPLLLADLLIERQLQKLLIRQEDNL